MMKQFIAYLLLPLSLMLSACSSEQFQMQPSTFTAFHDPCAAENLPSSVQGINDLMREFDDASQLASNLPAEQLPNVISNMQRIRRAAEDIQAPACLEALKSHELNHMNIMIDTLLAFVGGADQETLKKGLDNARQAHNLYSIEIVQLLGVTLAPITATPPSAATTTP